MIVLKKYQFEKICPKRNILGQCDWFRNPYGCTLEVKGDYYLNFATPEEETFFRIKYSDEISSKDFWVDITLDSWWMDGDDDNWQV
jgi:hypothetical protein